jgi:uracil-DNA glycosylase family 4
VPASTNQDSGVAPLTRLQDRQRACIRCVEAGFIAHANPVFSGRPGQRILLVGQAPGPVETEATRPFAGRAGRQLMRWFVRAGFADENDVRRRVYMTSMTTCFPGRRPGDRGDRPPSAGEVELCRGWLDGVLELLEPRLIIPIGSLAVSRFLPGRRLDETVGLAFDSAGAEVETVRVQPLMLPLPHPSGQSRWLNEPARLSRLDVALQRLAELVVWAETTGRSSDPVL